MFVTHNDVILSLCYQSQLGAFSRHTNDPDVEDVTCATVHNSDAFPNIPT
jgi:hypothetical protein